MVNVADGAHVNVRFITLKFFFRHDRPSKLTLSTRWQANHRTVYMMDLNKAGERLVLTGWFDCRTHPKVWLSELPLSHIQHLGAGSGIEPASSAWKAEVIAIIRCPHFSNPKNSNRREIWWREKDSNLRRQSRQIYSLIPLAAREPSSCINATTVILLAPVVFVAFAGQIDDRHPSVAHFMVRILGCNHCTLQKCAFMPGSRQKTLLLRPDRTRPCRSRSLGVWSPCPRNSDDTMTTEHNPICNSPANNGRYCAMRSPDPDRARSADPARDQREGVIAGSGRDLSAPLPSLNLYVKAKQRRSRCWSSFSVSPAARAPISSASPAAWRGHHGPVSCRHC